jgi:hypothetical protein
MAEEALAILEVPKKLAVFCQDTDGDHLRKML